MSKQSYIEKLLDGASIAWVPVAELFHLKSGYTPSKSTQEFWEGESIPWFSMDDIQKNGPLLDDSLQKISQEAVKDGKLFAANSMIFSTTATIGEHALITIPHLADKQFTNLTVKEEYIETVDTKFLYYCGFLLSDWCKKNTTMSRLASVDMDGFRKFVIPIPCPETPKKSLEIQGEIVRILDTFTSLTTELKTELTARKKQYNYYRSQLLTFSDDEVEWKPLGKIAKIKQGQDWKKLGDGDIPVYGPEGIMGYVDTYSHDQPSVLIPRKGSITNALYVDTPFWNADTIYYTDIDTSKTVPKYLYYHLKNMDLIALDGEAGKLGLTQAILAKLSIPIPFASDPQKSLAQQARIVSILDKFDTLTCSTTEGLPREIELREKQYEYYRNLLLKFPKPVEC